MAAEQLPLNISMAPFPEGFQGDMDETFQQAVQLMEAYVEGNFLPGMALPSGSTLPTTDQGPIAMGGIWYFYNPVTGLYQPQSITAKVAKNFVKNPVYQIQQTGSAFTVGAGVTKVYDMAQARSTLANVLTIAPDVGPLAGPTNDFVPSSIKYTVNGGVLVPTLGVTDFYAHEHLIEGADIAMLQGQIMTVTVWVWTNTPGTYSVYLASTGRDTSYVANFTVTAPNTFTAITIPGIPPIPATGTWSFNEGVVGMYIGVAFGVGTQWQTATPNVWQPSLAAGTSHNTNFLTVANNQIKITAIKLEASSVPSYVSVPSFDADFWECVRYYYTNFNYAPPPAGVFGLNLDAQTAGNAAGSMLFPRRMAKVPGITLYSPTTFTANTIRNLTTGVDVTAYGAPVASQKGVNFNAAITTPASVKADVLAALVTADARLGP